MDPALELQDLMPSSSTVTNVSNLGQLQKENYILVVSQAASR